MNDVASILGAGLGGGALSGLPWFLIVTAIQRVSKKYFYGWPYFGVGLLAVTLVSGWLVMLLPTSALGNLLGLFFFPIGLSILATELAYSRVRDKHDRAVHGEDTSAAEEDRSPTIEPNRKSDEVPNISNSTNEYSSSNHTGDDLVFKDNESAFEMACKYLEHPPLQGKTEIPALVVMDTNEARRQANVSTNKENRARTVLLRVASDDGGFLVPSEDPSPETAPLVKGDFVVWKAMQYSQDIGNVTEDRRFGWVGLIVAKLRPELDMNKGWKVERKFV